MSKLAKYLISDLKGDWSKPSIKFFRSNGAYGYIIWLTIINCYFEKKEISIEKNLDVFSIMQLRLHPVANKLKKLANELNRNNKNQISNIKFVTPRDDNYINSWKTDEALSGGILFNLGIHYFDLLIQSFGNPIQSDVEYINKLNAKGKTSFKNLTVIGLSFLGLPQIYFCPFESIKIIPLFL